MLSRSSSLFEVAPDDLARVRPLLADLAAIHLNIVAVLEGNAPGTISVDDPGRPRTAVLASSDAYYLGGDPHNQALSSALNAMLPSDTYFVLFCEAEGWEAARDLVLRHRYAVPAGRRYYTLGRLAIPDWRERVPAGFSVLPVDAQLLGQGLGNTDAMLEGLLECWSAVELYLQHGFGFCVAEGERIVAWSLCDYASGRRCEMGVNTAWRYRRRGLGTLAAAATAAAAVERGFTTVGWHCWANNVGSIGVGVNVGFERAADYTVYINHWAAENISDMSQEEFRAFATHYEEAFAAEPPAASGYPHIVAASAWALAGERGRCFEQLGRAVNLGWLRSAEQLRDIWPEFFWDPDLGQSEAWQALQARMSTR